METIEEAIRRLIKDEYGSVPKFAKAINLPASSIYSSLDRGIANTRTELSDRIYRALNIDWETAKLGDDNKCLKLKASAPSWSKLRIRNRFLTKCIPVIQRRSFSRSRESL